MSIGCVLWTLGIWASEFFSMSWCDLSNNRSNKCAEEIRLELASVGAKFGRKEV